MIFTVTYRDRTGAKREESVEANSRDAAFAAMKARGIVPAAVRAGATKPRNTRNTAVPYIIAVAFVLLLAGGAWWWLGRAGARPSRVVDVPVKSKAMPKEVKPSVAKGAKAVPVRPVRPMRKPIVPKTPEERLAFIKKIYGDNIPENLKSEVYFLEHPPTTTYRPMPRPEDVFKHPSEKTIAAVLLLKPGAFVMQRTVYDESFDEDFKKAMAEPTSIEDGDSDADRELKAAVSEVKAEFAERMAKGEKPSEIMTKAMEEAYELGKFTREIDEMLQEVEDDPTKTNQDVEDFVKAANELLKEKGLEQLEMPELLGRKVRLRRAIFKAQQSGETQTKGQQK